MVARDNGSKNIWTFLCVSLPPACNLYLHRLGQIAEKVKKSSKADFFKCEIILIFAPRLLFEMRLFSEKNSNRFTHDEIGKVLAERCGI